METSAREASEACSTAEPAADEASPQNSTVTLNVGGRLFTTLASTLQKDPKSLLEQLCLEVGNNRDSQTETPSTSRDGSAILPRDEAALREIMVEAAHCRLDGLRELVMPHGGWRPNYATQMRASAMHQLRGDKLGMKGALDLILMCACGDQGRSWPGAGTRVDVAVYDYAEHVGNSLAFTPPTAAAAGVQSGDACSTAGSLLYSRIKQSALFRGDANSRWFDTAHELRHRLMGEAPHLLDPDALDEGGMLPDGRQRGLYEVPAGGTGPGRSPLSTAEFTNSILEVHRRCAGSLPREERELRKSALYIINNLGMLTLALRLCDLKDVSVAVQAKHVPDEERDRAKAETEYPVLVLYDVRLAITLTL